VYERFSHFTKGEQLFLYEVWARSGLPTDNVTAVYPFASLAELQARGLDTRGIVVDPAGLYYSNLGAVCFKTSIFLHTNWKIKFNGVGYEMKWATSETLIHELAHACSPSIYPDTKPSIAATKRNYFGGEAGRVATLDLLERMSSGILSRGYRVNDYHHYNYAMYCAGRMTREQYLDEVFAIFVQFMFTRLNFLENQVKMGLIHRADADLFYRIMANLTKCSVPKLHERMHRTADMASREGAYFKHLGIGRVAA
jgi:hypothetical protein